MGELPKQVDQLYDVGFTSTRIDALEKTQERLAAYILIVKADHEIYKDLKDTMARQQSLGQGSYPKTLSEAMEILNQNQKRKKRSKSTSD